MAEKKKRGLLSWLGFGEEEQSPQTQTDSKVEQQTEEQPQAEVEQPVEKEESAQEAEVKDESR